MSNYAHDEYNKVKYADVQRLRRPVQQVVRLLILTRLKRSLSSVVIQVLLLKKLCQLSNHLIKNYAGTKNMGVIGGGMLGMTLAFRLTQEGHKVLSMNRRKEPVDLPVPGAWMA